MYMCHVLLQERGYPGAQNEHVYNMYSSFTVDRSIRDSEPFLFVWGKTLLLSLDFAFTATQNLCPKPQSPKLVGMQKSEEW